MDSQHPEKSLFSKFFNYYVDQPEVQAWISFYIILLITWAPPFFSHGVHILIELIKVMCSTRVLWRLGWDSDPPLLNCTQGSEMGTSLHALVSHPFIYSTVEHDMWTNISLIVNFPMEGLETVSISLSKSSNIWLRRVYLLGTRSELKVLVLSILLMDVMYPYACYSITISGHIPAFWNLPHTHNYKGIIPV